MVFPIGTPSTSKYSGNSFLFCSRSLCKSMCVHIVFMKFLCGLQRFVPFICLKSDTKRCKPHGTPSTWPLEDQEFYMSFSLRYLYEIFTRSLRDLDFARQGSRARQQASFLLFPSLPQASLITSTLQFDSLLYSSVYSLFYSTLFFYCSLFCASQAIEKPSPWVSISRRICLKNMCAPVKCWKNQCHKQLIHPARMTCISWTSQRHTVCGTRSWPRHKLPLWPSISKLSLI